MKRITILLDSIDIHPLSPVQITLPSLGSRKVSGQPAFAPTIMIFNGDSYQRHFMIPASTDRGGFRRASGRDIMDHVVAMDYDTVYFLLIGGVKGGDKNKIVNPAVQEQWREQNPFISVWGAGNPFIGGKIYVGHIIATYPIDNERFSTTLPSVRRDPLKDGDYPVRNLPEADQDKFTLQQKIVANRAPLKAANAEIETIEKARKVEASDKAAQVADRLAKLNKELGRKDDHPEYIRDVAAMRAELNDLTKKLKDANLSEVAVQLPLAGYQYIPPNTPMRQKIFLNDVTELEAGLVVEAFQRHTEKPYIGGKKSHGNGLVYRQYAVRVLTQDGYQDDGILTVTPFEGVTLEGSTVLHDAWTAWKTADKSKFNFKAIDLRDLPDASEDGETAEEVE
jgi:hypothetical protein